MVVIRKNGKLTVYSNRTNTANNNAEIPSSDPVVNKSLDNGNLFRESEIKQIQIPPERVQRMNESILEAESQKSVREKLNSEQS